MNRLPTRGALLSLLILTVSWTASAIRPFRAVDVLNGRKEVFTPSEHSGTGYDVQELYIDQPLDHFANETSSHTFHQRYFYSSRYTEAMARPDAPEYVFLCVGGEGPSLDASVLVDSVHCSGDMLELARILHEESAQAIVHLFALEHRYYGSSYPEFKNQDGNSQSPVTNENLQFLSSRQALGDLRNFIENMNHKYNLGKAKWMTFGGSYPGMMAAFARLELPHLIHAAVSNSAPIEMQLNFTGYKDRVSFDLQYPLVGGSQECLQVVMDGHDEIVKALAAGNSSNVASLFNVCKAESLLDQKNVEMWIGDGVIEIPAQENDPSCEGNSCNIQKLCESILDERNHSTPMEALALVSKLQHDDDCVVLDWNATIKYLASPDAQEDGLRSWLWQTCTEFGFYQTCEKSSLCPFARGFHTLTMDFEICEQAFGISREAVADSVQQSLKRYGGWNIQSSRILSMNGNVDPWSMLALTNDREGLPTHWVAGASHHFWTHPVKDTDSREVKIARDLIYLKVIEWLEQGSELLRLFEARKSQ